MTPSELRALADSREWHFKLDNPTFLGWSVVAIYELAALACVVTALHSRKERGPDRTVWWALAAGLALLGVNKQLNLQTFLIVVMRRMAVENGWWEKRRSAQMGFSLVFGVGLGALLTWLAVKCREFFKNNQYVFGGVIILCVFVALRAATINHADEFLRINLQDERWAWVLELLGSSLVGIGALQRNSLKSTE